MRNLDVLIIEDNEADAAQMRRALTKEFGPSVNVYVVENVRDIGGPKSPLTPDVVILDLGNTNGDAADSLKTTKRSVECPIIVVSSVEHMQYKLVAGDLGIQEWLKKDQIDELPDTVLRTLSREKQISRESQDLKTSMLGLARTYLADVSDLRRELKTVQTSLHELLKQNADIQRLLHGTSEKEGLLAKVQANSAFRTEQIWLLRALAASAITALFTYLFRG